LASARRFFLVRMSNSHSPHAESTTSRPFFFSSRPLRFFQNGFSSGWVWKPLT
jgi:hypothetical protein